MPIAAVGAAINAAPGLTGLGLWVVPAVLATISGEPHAREPRR